MDKKLFGLTSTVYHGGGFGMVQPNAPKPIHPAEAIGIPQIGKAFVQLPAVCLFLDILGFGRLILNSKPIDVAATSGFFFETCFNSLSVQGFDANEISELQSNFMRLSDTIALWAYTCESHNNAKSDTELQSRAMLWLLTVGQHLMRRGFRGKQFALRGAIAFGDCVQDIKGGAIIGAPWAYSANLEKAQQWAGIAIHPTAALLLTEEHKRLGLVMEYDVPLKDKNGHAKAERGWVIDWRDAGIQRSEIEETFSKLGQAGTEEVEKMENTLKFLNRERAGGSLV